MPRTKEPSETVMKVKEIRQEQKLLSERKNALSLLLMQQWENYRKTRAWKDMLLLLTILNEINLIDSQLLYWSHEERELETLKKRTAKQIPSVLITERIKAVSSELRELNKQRRATEKDAADALVKAVSVMEFMQVEDIMQLILLKIERLTAEKKALEQKAKERKKQIA